MSSVRLATGSAGLTDGKAGDAQDRDRREVLDRIVERMIGRDRIDHVRAGTALQQGVAVGRRVRDHGSAERAAGAADVLDHDGADERLHLLRPGPADGVVDAAGGEGNDQPDGAFRIFGLRHGRPRRQRPRREGGQSEA